MPCRTSGCVKKKQWQRAKKRSRKGWCRQRLQRRFSRGSVLAASHVGRARKRRVAIVTEESNRPTRYSPTGQAAGFALAYAVLAGTWILLSDTAVGLFTGTPLRVTALHSAKGCLFVAVTGLILFFLLRRVLSRLSASQDEIGIGEAKYRELFETNPHPMWVYDIESLAFLAVNKAAAALYGYSGEEFLAMTIKDIHPAEDIPRLLASVAAGSRGFNDAGVWRHRKKNGAVIEVAITSHAVSFGGRTAKIVLARDITLQRRAESALRQSEERYRKLVAASPDGISIVDTEGRIALVSPRVLALYGLTDESEALGTSVMEWVAPESHDKAAASLQRALQGKDLPDNDYVLLKRDGSRFHGEVNAATLTDELGAITGLILTTRDVTERWQAAQRIRRLSGLNAALSQSSQAIIRETDPDTLFQTICRIAAEHTSMHMAWIGMLSPDGRRVLPVGSYGDASWLPESIVIMADPDAPENRDPTAEAIRSGERSVSNDVAHSPAALAWREAAQERGFGSCAALPLRSEGRVVGALSVYAREADFFDDEAVSLLEKMSEDVSFAIENFAREKERRRTQAELRESEARFRHLLQSLDVVVWSSSLDASEMHYVNPAVEKVYGRPASDFVADPKLRLAAIHPEDLARVQAASERLFAEGYIETEYRIVRPNKEVRWLHDRASVIRDDAGQPTRLGGIASDITERKRAEAELRLLFLAVDQSPASIVITDPQGRIQYVNPKFCQVSGYVSEELVGCNPRILKSGDKPREEYRDLWNTITAGLTWQGQFCNRKRDGELYWEEATISPIVDELGNITNFIAVKENITAQKQAEDRVRESRAVLRTLIDAVPLWISYFDRDGRCIVANRRYAETLGKPLAQIEGAHYADVLTPELAAMHRPLAEQCLAGKVVTFAEEREVGQGRRIFVKGSYVPVLNEDGAVKGGVTAFTDITELRRAEERLLASEARLTEAQRMAHIGSWEWDLEYNDMVWSEELYRILEVDARFRAASYDAIMETVHPDDRVLVDRAYQDSVEHRTSYDVVHRLLMPNRRIKYVHGRCETLYGADGRPLRSLGTLQDVTDLKRAEAEIRRLNEQLERRVAERTAELERANRELESFSYSVSHDLRTPLRAINGFAHVVLEDEAERLSAAGKEMLERVARNSDRMGDLIDDILEYSRAGRVALRQGRVDLPELARSVIADLRDVYPSAQIVLHPLPPVQGDATMVRLVLTNLLDNALKFSAKRTPPRAEIGAQDNGAAGHAFFVKDNGAGFDMRYADKLFGIFQRMHGESQFPGTGVGLAIVKRLVERHGGRVWAEAAPDQGATFYFTLGPGSPAHTPH